MLWDPDQIPQFGQKFITHLNDSNSNGFTPNGTRGYPEVQNLIMSKLIKEM